MKLGLAALALLTSIAGARADDPVANGKKLSEWLTMLKEDTLPRKRKAAVIVLGQMAGESKETLAVVLPALGKAMRNETNAGVRGQIATVFGAQPPEAMPLFVTDLAEAVRLEKDSAARREQAVALGRMGKIARPAVLPLIDTLKDAAPATRAAAADALGRIGGDARSATVALLPLLKDANRSVRLAAIFALGRVDPEDPEPVSEAFVGILGAQANRDRMLAGAASVASSLAWAERRDDEMVQETVVALGLLGDRSPEVVQAVANRLPDASVEVRRQAALALAKFGPASRGAEKSLVQSFHGDDDKTTRIYALHALCTSFGTDAASVVGTVSARLAGEPEAEVRVAIAEELGAFGPAAKEALPALRAAQRDPQIKVREAAAVALRNIQKLPEKSKP